MARSFDDCNLLTFEHFYLNSPSIEFECTDEFLIFNSYIRELILRPSVAYKMSSVSRWYVIIVLTGMRFFIQNYFTIKMWEVLLQWHG